MYTLLKKMYHAFMYRFSVAYYVSYWEPSDEEWVAIERARAELEAQDELEWTRVY